MEAGLPLGDEIKDVITIVQPETFQRWVRDNRRGTEERIRRAPRAATHW